MIIVICYSPSRKWKFNEKWRPRRRRSASKFICLPFESIERWNWIKEGNRPIVFSFLLSFLLEIKIAANLCIMRKLFEKASSWNKLILIRNRKIHFLLYVTFLRNLQFTRRKSKTNAQLQMKNWNCYKLSHKLFHLSNKNTF